MLVKIGPYTKRYGFFHWLFKRERKIKIKIHDYDTWNMDHTLSLIILPMLKQLKETKHGAPFVDDEDVPENIRSTNAKPNENEHTDEFHFARWDFVMDEMIFAFEHLVDDDWENKFYSGDIDLKWKPVNPEETDKDKQLFEMYEGENHTFKVDDEGIKKVSDRIQNGLRLFSKYYRNLWD